MNTLNLKTTDNNKNNNNFSNTLLNLYKMGLVMIVFLIAFSGKLNAQNQEQVASHRIAEYIHWYPAIKQAEMRDQWLENHKPGEWQISGLVTADDRTVVTVQADVNYGYSWFNISNEPVVITMPAYDKYYSVTVFDMHHFMEVVVTPEKPVVVRLPHQKSPVEGAHEIVLHTYQGMAFTRQVIVDNEQEVVELAKEISITGGGGDKPFIIPDFTAAEKAAAEQIIVDYARTVTSGRNLFGSAYEGVGDLDRSAGVYRGQLGTQSYVVDYAVSLADQNQEALNGSDQYEMTVSAEALTRSSKGYWSLTIYSSEDNYLIPNKANSYVINSYNAVQNDDGTVTILINTNGEGDNALPTEGTPFYAVFRVYEPIEGIQFPTIEKVQTDSSL